MHIFRDWFLTKPSPRVALHARIWECSFPGLPVSRPPCYSCSSPFFSFLHFLCQSAHVSPTCPLSPRCAHLHLDYQSLLVAPPPAQHTQCRVSLSKAQGHSCPLFLTQHLRGFLIAYESTQPFLTVTQGHSPPTNFPFSPLLHCSHHAVSCGPGTMGRLLIIPYSEPFLCLCFPSQVCDAFHLFFMYLL